MPVSLLGVTDACGLPPVKSAHKTVTGVGVAVTGISFEVPLQVWSYSLVLLTGVQVPNVALLVPALAYQAVVTVSSAVPTLIYRVLAGTVPEMVSEIPLNAEASSREQPTPPVIFQ